MLELLTTRGDEDFEKLCQALKATGQAAVVWTYLQKFRVCVIIEQLPSVSCTAVILIYLNNILATQIVKLFFHQLVQSVPVV